MSSNEWREVKLGEIVDIEMGQSPKSEFYNTEGLGVPFLQGNKTFGMIYPKFDVFCTNVKKIAIQNDILMSVRAPVGDLNIAQEKICIGRGICAMRMKNRNNLYLFYLLKHNVKNLKKTESGTVFGGVNKKDIMGLSVMWTPNLQEQKTIAATLSCLDDKIELNNRINKTLEEMAQAIFKSWFVDFEPFQNGEFIDSELGKIPKGWRVGVASDFFNIGIGKTPPRKELECFSKNRNNNIKWVSISDMGNSGVFIFNTSEYLTQTAVGKYRVKIVPAGTIILSFKLTVGRVAITSEEMATNEAIAHFKSNRTNIREYLYFYLKMFNYESLGNTSSIASAVNSKVIKAMSMIMPDEETLNKFHDNAFLIMENIRKNQEENQILISVRDALLPKLMSGEVRVPIEEVL